MDECGGYRSVSKFKILGGKSLIAFSRKMLRRCSIFSTMIMKQSGFSVADNLSEESLMKKVFHFYKKKISIIVRIKVEKCRVCLFFPTCHDLSKMGN